MLLGVVALGVPLVWGSQAPPVELPFVDGLAWLGNSSAGEVVQVNGQTGTVQARLGDLEGEVTIAQTSDTVLVQVDDEIRQIDPDSLEWGQSLQADGELVVGEDDDGAPVAYLVHPHQQVLTLDPLTLAVTAEVDLAGTPRAGVVAPGGELVVPVRTSDGVMVEVVDGDRSTGTAPVGDPGDHVQLTRADNAVLALNVTTRDLHTLDLGDAAPQVATTAALDPPSGQLLVPGELPEGPLWLLASRDGDLLAVDTVQGEVDGIVPVADPGSDLVGPVVLDDVVYVLNRTLGELVRVDAATLEPISTPRSAGPAHPSTRPGPVPGS